MPWTFNKCSCSVPVLTGVSRSASLWHVRTISRKLLSIWTILMTQSKLLLQLCTHFNRHWPWPVFLFFLTDFSFHSVLTLRTVAHARCFLPHSIGNFWTCSFVCSISWGCHRKVTCWVLALACWSFAISVWFPRSILILSCRSPSAVYQPYSTACHIDKV